MSRWILRLYLRCVNPAVAIFVFLACVYAASTDADGIHLEGIFSGGFATYFFAKGLFCGSALFIMGKILEVMLFPPTSDTPSIPAHPPHSPPA